MFREVKEVSEQFMLLYIFYYIALLSSKEKESVIMATSNVGSTVRGLALALSVSFIMYQVLNLVSAIKRLVVVQKRVANLHLDMVVIKEDIVNARI